MARATNSLFSLPLTIPSYRVSYFLTHSTLFFFFFFCTRGSATTQTGVRTCTTERARDSVRLSTRDTACVLTRSFVLGYVVAWLRA